MSAPSMEVVVYLSLITTAYAACTCLKQNILANNPVAYYPMDEGSGTTAFNVASGPYGSYDATWVNGVPYVSSGLTCDPSSSVPSLNQNSNHHATISTAALPAFSPASDVFSVEIWHKPNSGGANTWRSLFGCRRPPSSGAGYNIYISTSNTYNIHIPVGSNWYSTFSSTSVTYGVWNHIVLTHAANGETKMYLNGTVIMDVNRAHNPQTTVTPTIGANSDNINAYDYHGELAHLAFYNTTLSQAEVTEHYNWMDSYGCAGVCTDGTPNDPSVELATPVLVSQSISNNNYEFSIDHDYRFNSIKVDFAGSTLCDHDSTQGFTNGYTSSTTGDACTARLSFSQPAQNMLSNGGCDFDRNDEATEAVYTKTITVITNQTLRWSHDQNTRNSSYFQIKHTQFTLFIRVPFNVTASATNLQVTGNITVLSGVTGLSVDVPSSGLYTVDFTLLTSSQAPYQLTYNSFTSSADLGNSINAPSTNPPTCTTGPENSCSQSFSFTGLEITQTCPTKQTLNDAMTVTFDVGCVSTFTGGCTTPNPSQITVSFNLVSSPYCPVVDNVTLSATLDTYKDVSLDDANAWSVNQKTAQFVMGATIFGQVEVTVGQNAASTASTVLTSLKSEGNGVVTLVSGGSPQKTGVAVQNGDATINFGGSYASQTRFSVLLDHSETVVLDPVSDVSQAVKLTAVVTVTYTTAGEHSDHPLLQDWASEHDGQSRRVTLLSSSRGSSTSKFVSISNGLGNANGASASSGGMSSMTVVMGVVAGVAVLGLVGAYKAGFRQGTEEDTAEQGKNMLKATSNISEEDMEAVVVDDTVASSTASVTE